IDGEVRPSDATGGVHLRVEELDGVRHRSPEDAEGPGQGQERTESRGRRQQRGSDRRRARRGGNDRPGREADPRTKQDGHEGEAERRRGSQERIPPTGSSLPTARTFASAGKTVQPKSGG